MLISITDISTGNLMSGCLRILLLYPCAGIKTGLDIAPKGAISHPLRGITEDMNSILRRTPRRQFAATILATIPLMWWNIKRANQIIWFRSHDSQGGVMEFKAFILLSIELSDPIT